ncbi:MAG: hypothetical protein QOE70_2117 [Chthoniobacter sp.]|jgi:hypothetical protein|nr:hypothetical protein [Chthoniobacter sp.]
MPRVTRLELLLFLATFFAFAYFNQGGGWNQNSRFAEVRAMAEEGRFALDDFLVYRRDPTHGDLVRLPARHAEYDFNGQHYRLAWVDMEYNLIPMNPGPAAEGTKDAPMIEVCASGDVGYVPKTGHFHPNKPPGTSFFALPGYWLTFQIERALGMNRDHWWTLNLNAWLATVLSVGLMSALGCVVFFRLAREFAGGAEMPAVLATFAFAFGTTFFPFGTILFDHNLTASLLIISFYFLRRGGGRACAMAGLCAGLAVLTNYVAAGAVLALGLYALLAGNATPRAWNWRGAMVFAMGGLPIALLLGWYHTVNFGSPLSLANDFQNPVFRDPRGSLGMFGKPNPYVAALLLVSPYRGLFLLAPVLIFGGWGLFTWLREKTWVAEARLCLAIFAFFFLVNMSFNGYHGGFAAGPRYLVPGIPFLALPLVVAFVRWRKTTLALLAISIAQQLLLTATDGQNPLAVGGHARLDDAHRKDDFWCSIVWEYAWPLFATGRTGGLLDQLLAANLDREATRLGREIEDPAERARQLEQDRAELRASIDRGEQRPFLLAAIHGPVSVNPVGVYDGLLGFGNFDMDSEPAHWASFNAGELLWPQSRWSLLPLLLVGGGLTVLVVRQAQSQGRSPYLG